MHRGSISETSAYYCGSEVQIYTDIRQECLLENHRVTSLKQAILICKTINRIAILDVSCFLPFFFLFIHIYMYIYSNQIFPYTRCITLKPVTSLRGPSPRHCATAPSQHSSQHSSFRRNIAAVASRWQDYIRFDRPGI